MIPQAHPLFATTHSFTAQRRESKVKHFLKKLASKASSLSSLLSRESRASQETCADTLPAHPTTVEVGFDYDTQSTHMSDADGLDAIDAQWVRRYGPEVEMEYGLRPAETLAVLDEPDRSGASHEPGFYEDQDDVIEGSREQDGDEDADGEESVSYWTQSDGDVPDNTDLHGKFIFGYRVVKRNTDTCGRGCSKNDNAHNWKSGDELNGKVLKDNGSNNDKNDQTIECHEHMETPNTTEWLEMVSSVDPSMLEVTYVGFHNALDTQSVISVYRRIVKKAKKLMKLVRCKLFARSLFKSQVRV